MSGTRVCSCQKCIKAKRGELDLHGYIDLLKHKEKKNQRIAIEIKNQDNKSMFFTCEDQNILIATWNGEVKKIEEMWEEDYKIKASGMISRNTLREKPEIYEDLRKTPLSQNLV